MYIRKNRLNGIYDDGVNGCEKNDGGSDDENRWNAVFDAGYKRVFIFSKVV